jgi:chromosome segregation ATPase
MWHVDVENIGGIRAGTATVQPGVNAIQASNWQGKTSLITALRAVLGGEVTPATVTNGEQRGNVTLRSDTEDGSSAEHEVEVERVGAGVTRDGTPFLTDPEDQMCADLFAFLDGRNEIRAAVRNGDDLTPLLTRPFDQMNIDERIRELKEERRQLDSEIDRAERAASKLPSKEEKRQTIESELEETRSELDALEGNGTQSGQQEALRDELNQKVAQQEQLERKQTNLQSQIETTEQRLEEKRSELDDLDVPDEPELEAELNDARSRLSEVEQEIETLEALYNVNTQILEQNQLSLVTEVSRQVDDDQLACWVCGQDTTRSDVEARLDSLSEAVNTRRDTAAELRSEVDDLEQRQTDIQRTQRQHDRLQSEITTLETRLDEHRAELETTTGRLEALATEIDELEDQVEETDDRRSELEQEIARKEATLDRLQDEIEDLNQQADRQADLETQRDQLSDEIEDLRTRRERTVERVREAFEEALADVLEEFGPTFQSARLKKRTDPDTGRTTDLELVLAREGREITVDDLSEGEVELVGFMATLAGYEAFDVRDRLPFLLLDDVGGLASEHLHTLVTYLTGRAEYVVTSAYPEAGEFDGHQLSPDSWDIVADELEPPA